MKVDLGCISGTIRDRADRKRLAIDLEEEGRSGSLDSCFRRAIVFRREPRVHKYRGRMNERNERRGTKGESENE